MVKKTMTYMGFDDEERTEDFLFNLTHAEIVEMDYEVDGGLTDTLRKIVAAKDTKQIMGHFKRILLRAYGEKSPDGKRFVKSEELSKAFSETTAYNDLIMEFLAHPDRAAEFFKAIVPPKTT